MQDRVQGNGGESTSAAQEESVQPKRQRHVQETP